MAQILILSFSPLLSDARVQRQARELSTRYDVTTAAFGASPIAECDHVELRKVTQGIKKVIAGLQILLKVDKSYLPDSDAFKHITSNVDVSRFDLVIANDVDALPLAFRIAEGRPILLDAHEYSLDDDAVGMAGKMILRRKKIICNRLLRHATKMTTVSAPIAELYSEKLQIPYPTVIPNASYFQTLNPSPVDPRKIQLFHHGLYTPNRGIEVLIDAVAKLGRGYVLNLMLLADSKTIGKLSLRAEESGSNVKFHPPVAVDRIATYINQFDIALYALPPSTTNARMALPNKFFDNVQGRLCQVLSPVGEMQRILQEHELGRISSDVDAESIAETVSMLSAADIASYKLNAHRAAQVLSWESYAPALHSVVESALAEGRNKPQE